MQTRLARTSGTLLMLATLGVLAAIGPASAKERKRLLLPEKLAIQRTLQLSPGSGVVPGYKKPKLSKPYTAKRVILHEGVPIGVKTTDGAVKPVGSYGR